MFSICKSFIKVEDNLFLVQKIYEEERVKNADLIKEWLDSTNIFRKDAKLYFCQKVDEVEEIITQELNIEKTETNE